MNFDEKRRLLTRNMPEKTGKVGKGEEEEEE